MHIYIIYFYVYARGLAPREAGGGGLSGRGENSTDGADSAFGNGRVGRFGPHSPHGQDHHPWALLSGDVRIRKVSLAVAKTSVSFLEGWYRVSGPLLGRRDAAAGVPGPQGWCCGRIPKFQGACYLKWKRESFKPPFFVTVV